MRRSTEGFDFDLVLRRVASADTEEGVTSLLAGRSGVSPQFWAAVGSFSADMRSCPRLDDAYFPESPALEPPEPMPIDRKTIAGELGALHRLSAEALKQLRRDFAAANHPDRVAPPLRERATIRMMVANDLIDAALEAHTRRKP